MGSSSSRNVTSSSRPQRSTNNLMRRTLSSLVCGGSSHASSSRPPVPIEHHSEVLLATSADSCFEITNEGGNVRNGVITLNNEIESLSENINLIRQDMAAENCLRINEESKQGKFLSKSKELVTSNEASVEYDHGESSWEGNSATSSTSAIQQSSLSIPVGASSHINTARADNSVNKIPSMNSLQTGHISTMSHEELRSAQLGAVTGQSNIDTSSFPSVPIVPISSENADDGSHHETVPASLGVLVSSRERAPEDGSMFHLDVVSIASDILSSSNADISSNREARRNSRRLFWDAFSRRGSRGHINSPTLLFSTDDADDLGSRGGRWLLDFNGDLFDDAVGGASSGFLGSRVHRLNERHRQSRSEIRDRLRGGTDDSQRSTLCPSGLHPDGTCSCESVLTNEESSTRASITRIVMLAEALFEVLDEIHRQPLSLSLSMVSLPAPESVVDSFPLKNHKKSEMVENDEVKQCYICLDEYEDGDKIRVLPCHHEYHMSCVDKWLKEIHGVCPLCRGDVCNGGHQEVPF